MGEKYNRQIRKNVNRLWSKAFVELRKYVESLPLRNRIKLAFNMVFKGKFEM